MKSCARCACDSVSKGGVESAVVLLLSTQSSVRWAGIASLVVALVIGEGWSYDASYRYDSHTHLY